MSGFWLTVLGYAVTIFFAIVIFYAMAYSFQKGWLSVPA